MSTRIWTGVLLNVTPRTLPFLTILWWWYIIASNCQALLTLSCMSSSLGSTISTCLQLSDLICQTSLHQNTRQHGCFNSCKPFKCCFGMPRLYSVTKAVRVVILAPYTIVIIVDKVLQELVSQDWRTTRLTRSYGCALALLRSCEAVIS